MPLKKALIYVEPAVARFCYTEKIIKKKCNKTGVSVCVCVHMRVLG